MCLTIAKSSHARPTLAKQTHSAEHKDHAWVKAISLVYFGFSRDFSPTRYNNNNNNNNNKAF